MADPTGARWRKSTRSGNSGNCVEVAENLLGREGVVFVRDSKNPDKASLAIGPRTWQAFIDGIRAGEFD